MATYNSSQLKKFKVVGGVATPFTDLAEALADPTERDRFDEKIVLKAGVPTVYWYRDGVGNLNLIEKYAASAGIYTVDNGLTENTLNNFQLGGDLIQNTHLTDSYNLAIDTGTMSVGDISASGARLRVQNLTDSTGVPIYSLKSTTPAVDDSGVSIYGDRHIENTALADISVQSGIYGQLATTNPSGFSYTNPATYTNMSGLIGVFTMYANTGNLSAGNSIFSGGAYYIHLAGTGNVDRITALRVNNPLQTPGRDSYTGLVTDYYGIYIDDVANSSLSGAILNPYGIFQEGATEINVLVGSTKIGGTVIEDTSILDIQSTTKGVLVPRMTTTERNAISTPATGLMIYDTTIDAHSIYDGVRWTYTAKILTATATLDFPNTSSNSFADLTMTLTGAEDGDFVSLGVADASVPDGISYFAWVSASDTVTVRLMNGTAGSIDPVSGVFKAVVFKN